MIRTVFLGTPDSAVPTLEAVASTTDLQLVVTMPDRPVRRSSAPVPSPVRLAADALGVNVATPNSRDELREALAPFDVDLGVVVAYGRILPLDVLEHPRLGMVNVHFSLLPRWRGAAPVERAMLAGDPITGITLMQVDEGMDTGPILGTWATGIEGDETAGHLTDRLATAGAELLATSLPAIADQTLEPIAQDESGATHAPRLVTAEAQIDWSSTAEEIVRAVRAYNPRPGAFTFRGDHRVKIHRARSVGGGSAPGSITVKDGRVVVGSGSGQVELLEVQPAGSKAMSASDWGRGLHDAEVPFT